MNGSVPDIYDDGSDVDTYDPTTTTGTFDPMSTDSVATMRVDTDGDGIADTTMIDFNGDGVADAYDFTDPTTGLEVLAVDADGDGRIDTVMEDTDHNGSFDTGITDSNGDGVPDATFDPTTGEVTDASTDPNAPDPFQPDDPDVHGDPMADSVYHQAQAGSNDCLPTSVAMVLSEVTGDEVPATEVVDLADELRLLGPDGMSMDGGVSLLEHFGVDAQVETGNVDDLRAMLDAHRPVIIGLDSNDLYGAGDAPFADDLVTGHAVVITGIDDQAGLVYINDPGFPDGAGVAIPLSEFEDAWRDADHEMIVADGTPSSAATGADGMPVDPTSASPSVDELSPDAAAGTERLAQLILLPFNLKI